MPQDAKKTRRNDAAVKGVIHIEHFEIQGIG